MLNKTPLLALVLLAAAFTACNVGRQSTTETPSIAIIPSGETNNTGEEVASQDNGDSYQPEEAPEPAWAPKKYGYKPSYTQHHDLKHTRLEVSFDWANRQLNGLATLTLAPYFYATDSLVLDAKGFVVKSVNLRAPKGTLQPLTYTYTDQRKLRIKLDRKYQSKEDFTVVIDYTARPEELPKGGSAAITSDKGLYFINHDGRDAKKPMQIWTQGETEASSCWFPTLDASNQRTTQELYMTVADTLQTLSNGLLVSSKKLPGGLRQDYWKMDKPHAPYLFMMAVGRFSVVKDRWRDLEVNYYVEPKYEKYARLIFGETPKMLEFYSNVLGVPYPWQKFSQITVRDFVSGAMENTTAVIHYEPVGNHDDREHLDEPHQDIIAHELFHHWFGDLVTCESWANIPLNESFATYGEYLWFEHRNGREQADYHIEQDLQNYLGEAEEKREPLIRYYHNDREDMFDRHSYQKGGRVLHMLRKTVGDEAFFASLKHYLTKHAYTDVEIHELRMAFEDVTGQDMSWFFNQWFLEAGHPELDVTYSYNAFTQTAQVQVKQNQDLRYQPLYRLPTSVAITAADGSTRTYPVEVTTADTFFSFTGYATAPQLMDLDPEKVLLADITENGKELAHWLTQLKSSRYKARQLAIAALTYLAAEEETPAKEEVATAFIGLLDHPFWATRQEALGALAENYPKYLRRDLQEKLQRLATRDPQAVVRNAATEALITQYLQVGNAPAGDVSPDELRAQALAVFRKAATDSSYSVTANGLKGLFFADQAAALALLPSLRKLDNFAIQETVLGIMNRTGDGGTMSYAMDLINTRGENFDKYRLLMMMGGIVSAQPKQDRQPALDLLMKTAKDSPTWFVRLGAARSLKQLAQEHPELVTFLNELKANEKDPQLQRFYAGEL